MSIRATALLAVLLLLTFTASSRPTSTAQNPKPTASPSPAASPEEEIDPADVISVNTAEVLLPVTVRDAAGQIVKGLTRDDFRVFEDGVQQPLSDLSLREVPVDVGLLVDASSSVANNLDDFRQAVEGFATHLNADDRISLIQFDDRVLLLQDWTSSRVQLRRALKRLMPGMFTRFHDAMLLATRDQRPRSSARHALIVLTDGIDSGRGATFDSALRSALHSQTTIYVVANTQIERARKQTELSKLVSGGEAQVKFNQLRIEDLRLGLAALDASERNLSELTQATGGRLYRPTSFGELERTYAEVADELRHQYALYFSPINKERDGRFRQVRVETSNAAFRVSARIGYFGPK